MASEPAGTRAAAPPDPHVALLLPTQSKVFGRHAAALRDGFMAAAKKQEAGPALAVRDYAVTEEVADALRQYRNAVAAGAKVVVGPLTRDAVTALAFGEPVPVPTLALNVPEQTGRAPDNLYQLGLQVESEARQAAQLAARENRRQAVIITGSGALHRRLQAAFSAEFSRLGGRILAESVPPDPARLAAALRGEADMVFLALDPAEARAVRSYAGSLPAYATSGINGSDRGALAAFDLAGVTFVDMPWLLEPDHPAVMNYPRADAGSAELDRLYALGIDAWRVARLLAGGARELRLDGVTGDLALTANGSIERTLRAARFTDGKARLIEAAAREPLR